MQVTYKVCYYEQLGFIRLLLSINLFSSLRFRSLNSSQIDTDCLKLLAEIHIFCCCDLLHIEFENGFQWVSVSDCGS